MTRTRNSARAAARKKAPTVEKSTAPRTSRGQAKQVSIATLGSTPTSLKAYTEGALYEYGSYVVEQRAVPDFRDGLKPSHRAILWAMTGLGLRNSGGVKKAARTVGEAIGKFHPHGDAGVYQAMVTIANTSPRLVEGQGNWGSPVSGAAAYRYTEAKLSKFSDMFLLDKGYLNVVPMIPNFSEDDKIPLHLPATLPVILLMGNPTAPAYGVRAGNPPFGLDGVAKLVVAALKGRTITDAACVKYLVPHYSYGCHFVSSEEEYSEFIKTGKGSLKFVPEINADWDNKIIEIASYAPGFRSETSVQNKLEKISSFEGVSQAYDSCSKKEPKSGPFGAYYVVKPVRGIAEDSFYDLAEKISKELVGSESYDMGFTIRKKDSTSFGRCGFARFINNWVKYRINLETRYIKYLIDETQKKLDYQELLLFAVDNRALLLKHLNKVLASKTPDEALARIIKKPVEYARKILDLQLRRLANLERPALVAKIKELKAELRVLNKDLKQPGLRAADYTVEKVKEYRTHLSKKGK